jgi:hypothetical protein
MRLPRWTVYPALALIASMLVLAFPHPQADRHLGAAQRAQDEPGSSAETDLTSEADAEASLERQRAEDDALTPKD